VRAGTKCGEDQPEGNLTTLLRRSHHFRHSVGLGEVERCLLDWNAEEDSEAETELDLSLLRNVESGAGVRLTNAMRRWSAGRLVVVLAPDVDLHSSEWFRLFTRSGIGWALATHATLIRSGEREFSEEIRSYYATLGSTEANNCLMYRGLESGAMAPNQDRFIASLFASMREHVSRAEKWIEIEDRRSIARLAYEAIANVIDHAFGSPWQAGAEQLSYLSVRWYQTISASSDDLGGLYSYRQSHCRSLDPGEEISGWLEIVVADDGVGIAARHHQISEKAIYAGPIAIEDAALSEALKSSATVKLRALDAQLRGEPGYGTTIMAECLKRAGAYAALRTGRRLVEYDPWRHGQFELHDAELGWMPGTAVQVLLPVLNPQLRLTN
jgi:hypothetical protein